MRARARVLAALAVAALAALAAVALAARAPDDRAAPPASAPAAVELTVYAAASLKGAIEAVRTAYEGSVPDTILLLATDSSTALATQIEQGAPADVFLSADAVNPRNLVRAGLADGVAVPFARNQLAIIVPAANPARIMSAADLVRPGVQIIAAGDAVPISTYAQALIADLAKESADPDGFAAAYGANIVSREDNVKAVVAKIELGEGQAAIVYATDAIASDEVVTIPISDDANVITAYEGLVVKASKRPIEARAFLHWLAGPDGSASLARFGFLPPS